MVDDKEVDFNFTYNLYNSLVNYPRDRRDTVRVSTQCYCRQRCYQDFQKWKDKVCFNCQPY